MRDEKQLDGLHAALARAVWAAAPVVRLTYRRGDDTLVAEIVPADPVDEVVAHEYLLVEFDGTDDDALPTALYLTRVRADPDGAAAVTARETLGEELWIAARALAAGPDSVVEVWLEPGEVAERRAVWRGLAGRLRLDRTIGVEIVPGTVHAVLTDGDATVLDEEVIALDRNDPPAVVDAVGAAVDALAARHPGTDAEHCAVGVQLGGPVHTPTGQVEHYDKPLHPDDETWKGVPLGDLLRSRTGRDVRIFNDAAALAQHEIRFGEGRRHTKVAVLVVRRGVGAKLIWHGAVVDEFPMEIGIFAPAPDAPLDHNPHRTTSTRSIETDSGTDAVAAAVARVSGEPCPDVEAAATVAQSSDAALQVFQDAGRGLARGIAAVQALLTPDRWVVFGPSALVDERRRAARGFMWGLQRVPENLGYDGLLPVIVVPRPTDGRLGAQAAAVACQSA